MSEYSDNGALVLRAQQGDEDAFAQLISENAGLIWSIARRYFGRGCDAEDLYQLGCVGFIKAVRGTTPSFGTQFSTYAVPKIAGEIRRFLRDDGPVKVSRGTKETSAKAHAHQVGARGQAWARGPALELSAESGMSPEDIAVCELASSPVQSLQQPLGDDGFALESTIGGESIENVIVERTALRSALRNCRNGSAPSFCCAITAA